MKSFKSFFMTATKNVEAGINDRSILQVSQRGVIMLHHIHSFVRRHISAVDLPSSNIRRKLLSRKRKCFNSRLHLSKMTSGHHPSKHCLPSQKSAMIKANQTPRQIPFLTWL
ncbi:hypothetical protein BASA83_007656 [Batrachochytrium salamandrivorans]|nr:hypothetical protein BASA83_007656 [Batrachochytrium salamandrivorans]